jgi:hypothetical protein
VSSTSYTPGSGSTYGRVRIGLVGVSLRDEGLGRVEGRNPKIRRALTNCIDREGGTERRVRSRRGHGSSCGVPNPSGSERGRR